MSSNKHLRHITSLASTPYVRGQSRDLNHAIRRAVRLLATLTQHRSHELQRNCHAGSRSVIRVLDNPRVVDVDHHMLNAPPVRDLMSPKNPASKQADCYSFYRILVLLNC